jgi:hypothetical protein
VQTSLFIGARGFVSRNYLDMTVARNPEDACPLQRFEGDVFTKIQEYSWNRIVRVNPLPLGASVGESGKALHPRNVGFAEIREISSQIIIGMTIPVS